MRTILITALLLLSLLVGWRYMPKKPVPTAATVAPIRLTGTKEDFITTRGKQYTNVIVTRVEPDGIIVERKEGISKLYFAELSEEVQERFHYDPQQATAYSAAQAATYEVYQKQQEEIRRQQEEAYARNWAANLQQERLTVMPRR